MYKSFVYCWKEVAGISHKNIFKSYSKIPALLGLMLQIIPVLLIVFIVRLIRPLIVIRFGHMVTERIGHLAMNTEIYKCEIEAGLHQDKTLDIFYHRELVCNQQLRNMWDRTLCV